MARTANPHVREALLDAARVELARVGLERARVEDIARRAGVSKGAFYLHFDTKEDVVRDILQRFLGAVEEHARARHDLEQRLEAEGAGLDRAFEVECDCDAELLEILWRNRTLLAVIDAVPTYAAIVADFRQRMRALVAERLRTRQSGGVLRRDVDPAVVADIVIGAYEDLGRRMVGMRERPDLAAWARTLLVVIYEGVLERGVRLRIAATPPRSNMTRRSTKDR